MEIWPFSVLRFSLGTRAKIVVTKKENLKPRESDISPICRDAPIGAIGLNFGLLGRIADVITHAKFCDNRFRGFGVLIPPILPFSIGTAGCPYNSVSTTVLHCDVATLLGVNFGHDFNFFKHVESVVASATSPRAIRTCQGE